MNILIVSKLFYPQNVIGAVRPTNMAKHLSRMGNDVVVMCSDSGEELSDDYEYGNVIRISGGFREKKNSKKNKTNNFSKVVITKRLSLKFLVVDWMDSFFWFRSCKKYIKEKCDKNQFDIVISSFGPVGSLWVGRYIKKHRYAKKWICDFRDQIENEIYYSWINSFLKHLEKRSFCYADIVTVVSKGQFITFKNMIGSEVVEPKCVVLYNGYDKVFPNLNEELNSSKLRFCYVGALYAGKRDASPLFKVIRECINEGLFSLEDIEFNYAGKEYGELVSQAGKYDLVSLCKNCGYISRKESLSLQQRSDILIVLSWNTYLEQGLLSGKFLEYLQTNKPIIAIIAGNQPGAELAELISLMQVGVAYEEVSHVIDEIKLKDYILSCMNYKKNNDRISFEPLKNEVEKFDYSNITKRLFGICKSLMNNSSDSYLEKNNHFKL